MSHVKSRSSWLDAFFLLAQHLAPFEDFDRPTRLPGAGDMLTHAPLPARRTGGDLMRLLAVPVGEVYLVLCNGRDITRSLHTEINTESVIDDGDVIALSGPVPYSWGYGAPVV